MHCLISTLNFFSRKPVLPIKQEFIPDYHHNSEKISRRSVDKYCRKMVKLKKSLFTKVHGNIKKAQFHYKKDYDKKYCRKKVHSTIVICFN